MSTSDNPTVIRKTTATVYTYTFLYTAATQALESARKEQRGRTYSCLTSMMFVTFAIEAYVNHLAETRVVGWQVLEKKLSVAEKLEFLGHSLRYTLDKSKRPFQSLNAMFKFRNTLAHGKTTVLTHTEEVPLDEDNGPATWPRPEWEALCTLETAERWMDDATQIIHALAHQAGHADPLDRLSDGWSDAKLKEPP